MCRPSAPRHLAVQGLRARRRAGRSAGPVARAVPALVGRVVGEPATQVLIVHVGALRSSSLLRPAELVDTPFPARHRPACEARASTTRLASESFRQQVGLFSGPILPLRGATVRSVGSSRSHPRWSPSRWHAAPRTLPRPSHPVCVTSSASTSRVELLDLERIACARGYRQRPAAGGRCRTAALRSIGPSISSSAAAQYTTSPTPAPCGSRR